MEIESDNGEKIHLKLNTPIVLGRGAGLDVNDMTVSRRHISPEMHSDGHESHRDSNPRVSFEVVGKNRVWVKRGEYGEIRVYGNREKEELRRGDAFSVCGRKHVWFRLRSEVRGRVEEEGFGDISDLEIEDFDVDVSGIDPVKEFGFIVAGHEFDSYSKRMIHDAKKWNWFLEEPIKGSDSEEADEQRSRGQRRKRKKGQWDDHGENDDDEWEGESEEDKELISKAKNVARPTYSTRSKDHRKSRKNVSKGNGKSEAQKSSTPSDEEMGDEDDETLGGFIVNSDEVVEDVGDGDEEDEEEEFEDYEEEDLA